MPLQIGYYVCLNKTIKLEFLFLSCIHTMHIQKRRVHEVGICYIHGITTCIFGLTILNVEVI